jgi:hypothetical protein
MPRRPTRAAPRSVPTCNRSTPRSAPIWTPRLIERRAGYALRSAAQNVIPYRGWVRKLTGAERYSREVAAAIAAGTVRRAYLKGIAQAGGCTAPAAPRN